MSRLQKKPAAPKEAIQHFKNEFFLLLWVNFALLDPDPDFEYGSGSGSTGSIEYGSNTDPDPDPDPKPWFFYRMIWPLPFTPLDTFCIFLRGLVCVGHSFAYVAHLYF